MRSNVSLSGNGEVAATGSILPHGKGFIWILAIGSLAACLLAPLWGPSTLTFARVWAGETEAQQIFWQLRVPRVGCAYLVGAILAVAGLVFQTLFRNPLATPFTLGVSSGAALFAALYAWTGLAFSWIGLAGSTIAAFSGAVLTLGAVLSISRRRVGSSSESILIIGMMLSFFFSSILMFVQYLSDVSQVFRMTRWLMGGLEASNQHSLWLIASFGLPLMVIGMRYHRELDVLQIGDELAAARGVEVKAVRWKMLVCSSLMVAVVVACAGPIGFVGIMIPSVVEHFVGSAHRLRLLACAFGGGLFLLISDTAARMVVAPYEVPVGIITALMGVPFFFAVLMRERAKPS